MTVKLSPRSKKTAREYTAEEITVLEEGAKNGLTAREISKKLLELGYDRDVIGIRVKLRNEGLSNGREKVSYTNEEDSLIAKLWEEGLSIPAMEKVFKEKAEAGETGVHSRSKHSISSRIYTKLLAREDDEQEAEVGDEE